MAARQRLSPEVRRRQIVEAAAELLLRRGYLPLPMEALAAAAGVSKGLVYGYFPTQWDLFNAVLVQELEVLKAGGLGQAMAEPDLTTRARACVDLYLRHVAARGPLVHYILRDSFMAGRIAPDAATLRDRLLRGFARLLRRELRLPPAEAVAVISMVVAVPEEMGRLVWQGELQLQRAREMAARLVDSSVAALRPS